MLSLACRNTAKLVRAKSKSENIRLGRIFTKKDTARLMAQMFNLRTGRGACTILDPGAGTGILAAALVERICRQMPGCEQIFLTCYENNPEFVPMLRDNLERIRKKCRHDYHVKLFATVYEENYIVEAKDHYTVTFTDTAEDTFDYIICRPPTGFFEKSSGEAQSAGGVTQLKVPAEHLFLKTALRHLEPGGQLVIMLPTAVATSPSAAPLRREIFAQLSLCGVHLFIGNRKNPSRAVPLKKEMILAFGRVPKPDSICIGVSDDAGTPEGTQRLAPLPYDFVVHADGTLTLPKSTEDAQIVRYISDFPETLESLGLKMYIGRVLDARCEGLLFSEPVKGAVPLIRAACLKGGGVEFPQPVRRQYIAAVKPALIQQNKNMIFIKRVPAKGDDRFVNASIYLASQLPAYRFVSTHNKILYIDTAERGAEMCARLIFGLFALLQSTIYDRYISIISKSKQISAKEMRTLPLPPRNIIENLGMRLMAMRQISVKACDSLVNPTLHIIEK